MHLCILPENVLDGAKQLLSPPQAPTQPQRIFHNSLDKYDGFRSCQLDLHNRTHIYAVCDKEDK